MGKVFILGVPEVIAMWELRTSSIYDGHYLRGGMQFILHDDGRQVTYAEVLELWRDDASFRSVFSAQLAAVPCRAFRWETPPITRATSHRPFEFVLLDCPSLDRQPDVLAFADYFHGAPASGVVAFPNLGGDAMLVVPCPLAAPSAYVHLAAFVREAPQSQQHALWQTVGQTMMQRLNDAPVWLSTAGAGVAWLHVRLDDQPKYYSSGSYRE